MVSVLTSRKGIFLTFIAVLMVTLLLLYASVQYEVSYKDTVPTETLRITGINNFITDFEESYLERALFASSHRALVAIINLTPTGGGASRITDINKEFKEAMLNATIGAGVTPVGYMQNDTLPVWIERLSNFSKNTLRADVRFNVTEVTITQDAITGPWLVNVSLTLNYVVNASDTRWERENISIFTSFDIFSFEDPYLKFKTDNRINRTIYRFNYTGANYLPENLSTLITSANFIYDRRAPSFLGRFRPFTDPDSRSDCCGIFSLVAGAHDSVFASNDRSYADFTYLDNFCFDDEVYSVNDLTLTEGIGEFYLDGYFVDKVFSLPPNETEQINSPEEGDVCGP